MVRFAFTSAVFSYVSSHRLSQLVRCNSFFLNGFRYLVVDLLDSNRRSKSVSVSADWDGTRAERLYFRGTDRHRCRPNQPPPFGPHRDVPDWGGVYARGVFPIFAATLLAQVIWGVGTTFASGATEAWIADELSAERVSAAFLRAVQIGQLASLVGIAVAVALGSVYLGLPLIVGGAGFLGVGVFLLLSMREDNFAPVPSSAHPLAAMGKTLRTGLTLVRRTPTLLTILVITGILGASSETFDRLWEARILRLGVPDLGALPDLAWFGLISAGAMILAALATEGVRRTNRSPRFTVKLLVGITTLLTLSVVGFGLTGNFLR